MAKSLAKLDQGDVFPSLTFKFLDGTSLEVPTKTPNEWSIMLFYRGEW